MSLKPNKRDLWFIIRKGGTAFKERAWRALMRRNDLTIDDFSTPFNADFSVDWKDNDQWKSRAWNEIDKHPGLTAALLRGLLATGRLGAAWEWRIRIRMLNLTDTGTMELWDLRSRLEEASRAPSYRFEELAKVLSEAVAKAPHDDPLAKASVPIGRVTKRSEPPDDVRNKISDLLREVNLRLLEREDLTSDMLRKLTPGLAPEQQSVACSRLLSLPHLTAPDLRAVMEFGHDDRRRDVLSLLDAFPTDALTLETALELPSHLESYAVPQEWKVAIYEALLRRAWIRATGAYRWSDIPTGWNREATQAACARLIAKTPLETYVLRNIVLFGDSRVASEACERLLDDPNAKTDDIQFAIMCGTTEAKELGIDRLIEHPESTIPELRNIVLAHFESFARSTSSESRFGAQGANLPTQRQKDAALSRLLRMPEPPIDEAEELLKQGSLDWKERDKDLILQLERKLLTLGQMGCLGSVLVSREDDWDDDL